MTSKNLVLTGKHIRLEPLERHHVAELVAAASGDRVLYQWSPVPQSKAEAEKYVDTALAWRDAGTAAPYATIRNSDNTFIKKVLKWEPSTTLEAGLKSTYAWINEQYYARKKGKRVVE